MKQNDESVNQLVFLSQGREIISNCDLMTYCPCVIQALCSSFVASEGRQLGQARDAHLY